MSLANKFEKIIALAEVLTQNHHFILINKIGDFWEAKVARTSMGNNFTKQLSIYVSATLPEDSVEQDPIEELLDKLITQLSESAKIMLKNVDRKKGTLEKLLNEGDDNEHDELGE